MMRVTHPVVEQKWCCVSGSQSNPRRGTRTVIIKLSTGQQLFKSENVSRSHLCYCLCSSFALNSIETIGLEKKLLVKNSPLWIWWKKGMFAKCCRHILTLEHVSNTVHYEEQQQWNVDYCAPPSFFWVLFCEDGAAFHLICAAKADKRGLCDVRSETKKPVDRFWAVMPLATGFKAELM